MKTVFKPSTLFLLALMIFSCKKEKKTPEPAPLPQPIPSITMSEIVRYPKDSITLDFSVTTTGGTAPYNYVWASPSTFSGAGPFKISTKEDMTIQVTVTDANNINAVVKYEVRKSEIDPLKYDYRKKYFGKYVCSYSGRISYSPDSVVSISGTDTIEVKAATDFTNIFIDRATSPDMAFNLPTETFGNSRGNGKFWKDSIYLYTFTTPIATSYRNYNGRKIK